MIGIGRIVTSAKKLETLGNNKYDRGVVNDA